MQLLMLLSLLLSLAATGVSGENLALGKHYELSPAPNYSQCTDPGDATQLTDGKTFGAGWTQASTVGWAHHPRPRITFDLGAIHPLSAIRLHTVGGGAADVFFPAVTAILLSDNGTDFSLAGVIGSGMLDQERGVKSYAHILEVTELRARARYVRLVFQTDERYLFLDEIEVLAGPEGAAVKPGESMTEVALDTVIKTGLAARWVASEWKDICKQITTFAGDRLKPAVEALDDRMWKLDLLDPRAGAAVLEEALRLRGEAARPLFGSTVLCYPLDPCSDLRGSHFPMSRPESGASTNLSLWQDEVESAAFCVVNLTNQPQRLKVRVSTLKDKTGKPVSWEKRLWLRHARPVPTRLGYRVMDALTLLGKGERNEAQLMLPAGEIAVVWLTVYSLDLPSGRYRSQLEVAPVASAKPALALPLTLTVVPLRMPREERMSLRSYHWDEMQGRNVPLGAADDMRAHGVNVFMLHPVALPRPVLNAERTKLESVDFTELDKGLELAQNPPLHGVFWGGPFPNLFQFDKPGEQELFKQWIRTWVRHLQEKGYGPERYFFYPYDEEIPEQFVLVARLIKEVGPRLRIFCDQLNAPPAALQAIAPYVDIWCVYYRHFTSELSPEQRQTFKTLREQNHFQLWTYACDGPGKNLSPDTYYRRLSWLAFSQGATGAGFWCYYGPTPWDDYSGDVHFELVYTAANAPPDVPRTETFIPSRRWEAWREATEDYEYLHRLQTAIETARKTGADPAVIAGAESTLQRVVAEVLEKPTVPGRYDQARRELTQQIMRLASALRR